MNEQLFRVTDAAIQFFDDYANPSERFRFTLERVGIDKFKEVDPRRLIMDVLT